MSTLLDVMVEPGIERLSGMGGWIKSFLGMGSEAMEKTIIRGNCAMWAGKK
jgi:hypothetical protein